MRRLPRLVAETPVNKSVPVTLWRKRAETTVQVKVGRLEESDQQVASTGGPPKKTPKSESSRVKTLGLTLSGITPELKDKYSLGDDAKGVVVVDVAKNSSAADKGLHPGDVIMEAAQEEVKIPETSPPRSTKQKSPGASRSCCWSSAKATSALSRCASIRVEGRRAGEIGLEVSLRIEEAGQIGVVEMRARGGGNQRLARKATPRPAARASADHWRRRRRRSPRRARCRARRRAPAMFASWFPRDDRRHHSAGQAVLVYLQSIGDDPVETELGGDAIGKDREPAGDEGSHRTGTAHGRDEALGAGGQPNRAAASARTRILVPVSKATRAARAAAKSISPFIARRVISAI